VQSQGRHRDDKGEQTLSEPSSRYGVHRNRIADWRQQATSSMAELFASNTARSRADEEKRIRDLYEKIGQRTVERDFLAKAFGR